MSEIDLSNFVHHERVGLTIYQRAMSPKLCRGILDIASQIVAQELMVVSSNERDVRRFRTSPILPIESIPVVGEEIAEVFPDELSTLRFNVQGPGGRQGWHQDYIPKPFVLYPDGEGFLEINPFAVTVEEARRDTNSEHNILFPVAAGDLAVFRKGKELFHRGRNASKLLPRIVAVLH